MAANQQLPTAVYQVGGQLTKSGWVITENSYGFEEDSEVKTKADGTFNADITYSRRQTLQVTLEALDAADVDEFQVGGQVDSGVFPLADGSTASAWKINDATLTKTRGPVQVELDLIQLGDMITST